MTPTDRRRVSVNVTDIISRISAPLDWKKGRAFPAHLSAQFLRSFPGLRAGWVFDPKTHDLALTIWSVLLLSTPVVVSHLRGMC